MSSSSDSDSENGGFGPGQSMEELVHKKKDKVEAEVEDDIERGNGHARHGSSSSSSSSGAALAGHGGEDDDEEVEVDEELEKVVSKYAKIRQPVPFSKQPPKNRINIEWRNINYKVTVPLPPTNILLKLLFKLPIPAMITGLFKKKLEMPILNNVSGSVRAGEVIAIMGPTGSGKTTLLNVLARRIKTGLTGEVLLNGAHVTGRRFKRRMAYVLQDDIFFPLISVRDTVTTAAYLKLPSSMSFKEKRSKVENVLSELGLTRCANTIVGGGWVRGVSGGERKRTNIATEIVNNPSLIFLDEPTSGLDAATSLGLIVSLKTLAKSGHTVITTIHQPSSAMFMMFDRVLLLAEGGWVVYSGSAAGVLPYFASLGLNAPPQYNPADFMLELVTSSEKMKDGRTVKQLLIDTYAENEKNEKSSSPNEDPKITEVEEKSLKDVKHGPKYQTPFWLQTYVLAKRTFKQRRHDILSWDKIILILCISVLSGLLWLQMDKDEESLGDRTGFLFFATMFWCLHSWFNALFTFPPERMVVTKERSTGTYRLSAYFLGKVIAESPLELVLPILYSCIVYWMVGLTANAGCFIFFIAIMCLFTLMGGGLGLVIGAIWTDMKKALTISTVVILGSVLLGGFFVAQDNLKVWIRWARWISFMKYSYELVLLNEFELGDDTYTPSNPTTYNIPPGGVITGGDVLDQYNIETNIWGDIIFVVGTIVVSRFVAYLALRFLNKPPR